MRLVFLATPDFAIPSLKKLIEETSIEIIAVITQPDKPVGRKKVITAPPVKTLALENNIPVFQPKKIRADEELIAKLRSLAPDIMVTCAFGQILSQEVLDIAPLGVVNVHASLLPKYRGPAPINWMIINGESEVGVTTMMTELGVDEGDMLLKYSTELAANENAAELTERLSVAGADLLLKTLLNIHNIKPEKQSYPSNHDHDTDLAPFMDKRLGEIDFSKSHLSLYSASPRQKDFKLEKVSSAQNIHNLVRGTYPWPGAYFMFKEQKIILLETEVYSRDKLEAKPAEIIEIDSSDESFLLQAHLGVLKILKLKPQGKSEMTAKAWLNGAQLKVGDSI